MKDYFQFDESEMAYLESINQDYDEQLSPYATKNSHFTRFKKDKVRYNVIRQAYSYDTDYILHSAFYNRYSDKTQVFSFYRNDDLTRRALHVQFVSKIARTIGRALKLNLDLIEAISLGHDIGHTPFGHKGEQFLSECYQAYSYSQTGTTRYFHHNVHSTRIFRYILDSNLTLQTLSGILSHNGEKVSKEYTPGEIRGFSEFDEILERCYVEKNFHKSLRPNTLEGCVVRISDMIAYAGKDRQDLYKARLMTKEEFERERIIGTNNRDIISNIVINVIKNSIHSPSLNMDAAVFDDLKNLIAENAKIIYAHEEIDRPYFEIIKPLMKKLYARLCDDLENKQYDSPVFAHYLNNKITGNVYRHPEKRYIIAPTYEIVADFIACMTDDYFIDICKFLHIDDDRIGALRYHEYFDEEFMQPRTAKKQ